MEDNINELVKKSINDQLSEYLHKSYTAGVKAGQTHEEPSKKTMELFNNLDKKFEVMITKMEYLVKKVDGLGDLDSRYVKKEDFKELKIGELDSKYVQKEDFKELKIVERLVFLEKKYWFGAGIIAIVLFLINKFT